MADGDEGVVAEEEAPPVAVTTTGDAAVVAIVTKDAATDMWAVDVTINHGDQTVVRVDGKAVWQGTR